MEGYEIVPDINNIGATKNKGTVSLHEGYIVGISAECFDDTQENLQISLNGSPWVTIKPGDKARQFGGFEVCNVPGHFTGELQWRFAMPRTTDAGQNRGLIIITRISKSAKEIK